MPYHSPLKQKGKQESPFAHAVKLCWFILRFKDIKEEYTLKRFCRDFPQIIETMSIFEILSSEYGIEWTFYNKDGSICLPDYRLVTQVWIKKYEWREQYPVFKSERLMSTKQTEREKYIRKMQELCDNDLNIIDNCYNKESEYLVREENGKDMTYYRNTNNETISNVEKRLRTRLDLDEQKVNLNANVNAEVRKPISPEDKLKNIMELKERLEEQGL